MLRKFNIFLILGIIVCLGAVAMGSYEAYFRILGKTSVGKVVSIVEKKGSTRSKNAYYPVVDFSLPDGTVQEFQVWYGSSINNFSINQKVDVLYDPNNPGFAIISGDWAQWAILGILSGLGLIFIFFGFLLRKAAIISPKLKAELLQTGRKIETTIVSGTIAFYINRHPIWEINSTYTEGGKIYKFHSEGLNFDVGGIINSKNIKTIPVWVARTNMKKYYMAVDELRELFNKNNNSENNPTDLAKGTS